MLHTQSIPHKTKGSSAVKAKEFCTKERKKMKKKRKKKIKHYPNRGTLGVNSIRKAVFLYYFVPFNVLSFKHLSHLIYTIPIILSISHCLAPDYVTIVSQHKITRFSCER